MRPAYLASASDLGVIPPKLCLIFLKFKEMKLKWSTVKLVLQIAATIVTTVFGTIAVQSCG